MPSRRQIREAAIQFLYCSDLEGGADPSGLREPFWEFLSETDRKNLQTATFRSVQHLAHGRSERLTEFVERSTPALAHLAAFPPAENLAILLNRLLALESSWSIAISKLGRIPKDGDDSDVAASLEDGLESLFKIDHDLAFHREQFLKATADHPSLTGQLEAVSASVRRLQRISDRLRMVEEPEKFPEQADLSKLRRSKADITGLRKSTDALVDSVLANKESLDGAIGSILENYAPERVDPVDRAILRLATYELLHTDIPRKAAINEALELAKRFGTTDSRRFVNGILDKIAGMANG